MLTQADGGLLTGRSHRSAPAKAQLVDICERSRRILGIPDDYRIGIVAGSDTGAFEAAMWSLLGPTGVDVFAWDVFGRDWLIDITEQLKPAGLADVRAFPAPFGQLPDLSQARPDRDIVFTWNGTTAGVRVPDADWIADTRTGLVFCDVISAIFATELPWTKLDVVSWSWQKGMGGEAQHGMLAFSPRALDRLRTHKPPWPLPKIFRLASWLHDDWLFSGDTINTPSMLCAADAVDALQWIENSGGLPAMIARVRESGAHIARWIEGSAWATFLAADPAIRSTTAHCITGSEARFAALDTDAQRRFVRAVAARLDKEGIACDIAGHRDAPPCWRLWTGPTVEPGDVARVLPWLDWAYALTWLDFA